MKNAPTSRRDPYILSTEETRAVVDRAFMKILGPEWRQPNGAPRSPFRDSMDIIMDDFNKTVDTAVGKADPR